MTNTFFSKFDVHVHCAPVRTPLSSGNPTDPLSHYAADPEEIKETLLKQGISRAVLMSGGENISQTAYHLGAFNEDCAKICADHPETFLWMCNVNAERPETLAERLAACKEAGAVGVGEVMVNEWLDSPFLTALFAAAEKLRLPVLCHMSPEPGFSYGVCDRAGLPLLEEVLTRFPDLIFIGHSQPFWTEISGGCEHLTREERNGFGRGPVAPGGTVERLLGTYPNLYADLSAYSGSCAVLRDPVYGPAFLERFHDRLLFGTDTLNERTVFPLGNYLDESLARGQLSRQAYEDICRGNAERLFCHAKS